MGCLVEGTACKIEHRVGRSILHALGQFHRAAHVGVTHAELARLVVVEFETGLAVRRDGGADGNELRHLVGEDRRLGRKLRVVNAPSWARVG